MISCCVCRQDPIKTVFWEAPHNSWLRCSHSLLYARRNSGSLVEEVGKRIKEPTGDGNSTRIATKSTKLHCCGFRETEQPTKEHTRTQHRPPHTYAADVQLVFICVPQQLEQKQPDSIILLVDPVPLPGLSWLASVGDDVTTPDLRCQGRLVLRGNLTPLRD